MSARFFVVFSFALFTLYFTLPDVQSLSVSEFDNFKGERICTDPNTHYKPADYCKRINNQLTADCSSLNLLMSDGTHETDLYSREVVACREKNIIIACVSGGKSDEYYLVWSYVYADPENAATAERCFHPQQVKIPNASAGEGTSTGVGTE